MKFVVRTLAGSIAILSMAFAASAQAQSFRPVPGQGPADMCDYGEDLFECGPRSIEDICEEKIQEPYQTCLELNNDAGCCADEAAAFYQLCVNNHGGPIPRPTEFADECEAADVQSPGGFRTWAERLDGLMGEDECDILDGIFTVVGEDCTDFYEQDCESDGRGGCDCSSSGEPVSTLCD
jgi:hypothetical protein